MTIKISQKMYLPYLVAIVGTLLSIIVWYELWQDIHGYFQLLTAFEDYLSWIALVLGMGFYFLLAVLIRTIQLAQQRAITLKETNDNLKREIAERIHAEESKQKLESALLQSQKLQAIGTLAGGIAHDFNNLLYAIIGYVEMVREDVPKESVPYKNLNKVLEASRRGQELVARILAFSRHQQHQLEIIDLKQTIEAALALLNATIPSSVMVNFAAHTEGKISGNQTQLHQVLLNIINNAVDAMDGEGSIDIDLTYLHNEDASLKQFPEIQKHNYYKIDITDSGQGMAPHIVKRIFEPFFTTKEVGKGTGLGLSMVHSIIKEHRGAITVKSQVGQGTTFTLLFPEAPAS